MFQAFSLLDQGSGSESGFGLLLLSSGLTGVVVSVTAGFIGAALQALREHSRWLRELRLTAFADLLTYMRKSDRLLSEYASRVKTVTALLADVKKAKNSTSSELDAMQEKVDRASDKVADTREKMSALISEWPSLVTSLDLLVPRSLRTKIDKLGEMLSFDERPSFHQLRNEVEEEMRDLLNIRDPKTPLRTRLRLRITALRGNFSRHSRRVRSVPRRGSGSTDENGTGSNAT